MRPSIGLDNGDPRPRKPSLTESPSIPGERPNLTPTTFFLTRESDSSRLCSERQNTSATSTSSSSAPVSTLQDLIQEAEHPSKQTPCRPGQPRSGSRRRSTIKPGTNIPLQRRSSSGSNEHNMPARQRDVTPSPLPSRDISLPSSPKSTSSKSVHRSDDGELTIDETGSQAIASSDEEDEDEIPAKVQDSQPELIMPSIKMPSRRPFTCRGKQLGRFKILVAGRKGTSPSNLAWTSTDLSGRSGQIFAYQVYCSSLRGYRPCRPTVPFEHSPQFSTRSQRIQWSSQRDICKYETISRMVVQYRGESYLEAKEEPGGFRAGTKPVLRGYT